MKLILANNQSTKFVSFYDDLRSRSKTPFDYAGYEALLFTFDSAADQPIMAVNLHQGRELSDYDGVYINGYLNTFELAATVAIACDSLGIPFVNSELKDPPSLSKLTEYAKLARAGIPIPLTFAGSKAALLQAGARIDGLSYPCVLKRADADRGIDNYKVGSAEEMAGLLEPHDRRSLWILQEFIPNDGFYRIGFHGSKPGFCIFRAMGERPDGNAQKAHMYKPKGGANASLLELSQVPEQLLTVAGAAMQAMGREIGGVDCLYDAAMDTVHILEVNYNPQLVTVDTYKDERIQAFLDYLDTPW